jgi:hypothetical protein
MVKDRGQGERGGKLSADAEKQSIETRRSIFDAKQVGSMVIVSVEGNLGHRREGKITSICKPSLSLGLCNCYVEGQTEPGPLNGPSEDACRIVTFNIESEYFQNNNGKFKKQKVDGSLAKYSFDKIGYIQ